MGRTVQLVFLPRGHTGSRVRDITSALVYLTFKKPVPDKKELTEKYARGSVTVDCRQSIFWAPSFQSSDARAWYEETA
jgi:hypothetical protein